MKIRAKFNIKDKPGEKFYDLQEGDEITVSDEIGAYWVKNGWVVNLDTGEDNEPADHPVTLDVANASLASSSNL